MKYFICNCFAATFILLVTGQIAGAQERGKPITWPDGKKLAISLSFDDSRLSQIDAGIPMLNEYGVKATFYLNPGPMRERLDGWKKAVAAGQEIGNHSLTHPCSGNYPWVGKGNDLEMMTLKQMKKNMLETTRILKDELGVTTTLFAYPCGQKYVGRGRKLKSYVPLVSKMFSSGRGWMDEMNNDPMYCDYAQLAGREMDGKTFDQIKKLIDGAKANGAWLLLAGHEMGEDGMQTTSISMLRELIKYAQDPANGVWLAPVGEVEKYIRTQRGDK
jgi:peptidoglycan/xylan/chitin deacetylase (PgdA/CDA1 family)